MITDKIDNLKCYFKINDDLKCIAEFIKNNNMKQLECGSYEVNDKVKVSISEYEPGKAGNPEAHRDYWDLQYAITGKEMIEIYPIENCSKSTGYKPDIEFFEEQNCAPTSVALEEGIFAILMPQDAHRPCARIPGTQSKTIKKAVFKIKIN